MTFYTRKNLSIKMFSLFYEKFENRTQVQHHPEDAITNGQKHSENKKWGESLNEVRSCRKEAKDQFANWDICYNVQRATPPWFGSQDGFTVTQSRRRESTEGLCKSTKG